MLVYCKGHWEEDRVRLEGQRENAASVLEDDRKSLLSDSTSRQENGAFIFKLCRKNPLGSNVCRTCLTLENMSKFLVYIRVKKVNL